MNPRPEHRFGSILSLWGRRYAFALRLAGCFSLTFISAAVGGLENCGQCIWIANGLGLSYLLLAPRWRWKQYLAANFAGILAAGLLLNPAGLFECVAFTLFNTGEVALAARALRKRSNVLPRFTEHQYLLRFAGWAVFGVPIATAILFTGVRWFWTRTFPLPFLLNWISTAALGTAITTPACVSIFQARLKLSGKLDRHWLFLIAFVLLTFGAFGQSHFPMLFLIYPVVGLILFRFGLGWASVSTLFVTVVGSGFTTHGIGPFAMVGSAISRSPTVLLQLYSASGIFLVFAAASVLENLHSTERHLRETVYLHDLVTENSRDVIILADFDGHRSYVSAAAAEWGGWRRDELLKMNSLDLVHPEDRSEAEAIVRNLHAGGEGGLLECRVRDRHGEYLWVEANLRAVRDPNTGRPIGILNMARDISKRKRAEHNLKRAYAALEALVITDPLTHLANRRSFDQRLANEWRRSMREKLPLSLLILDADWFKSYNDTYGHLRGDSCLKQIAESALDVIRRAGDLVARIGGEEFAVILPNTPNEGAMQLAELICASLRGRHLPHNTNPVGYVTISIGCATMVPGIGQHARVLMEQADEALYAAKHAGRNQACNATDSTLNVISVLSA